MKNLTLKRIIREGINLKIPVCGSSMFPILRTGDSVIVTFPDNLRKGDIILFRKDENIVCHRIMKIINIGGKVFYITRGDSLLYEDGPVSSDDIIGKVLVIERAQMTMPRRLLLFLYPLLRPRILNAILVRSLLTVKKLI